MSALISNRYASIGTRTVRFELGWFDGVAPALLQLGVGEWQHGKHIHGLDYYCLFEIKILKFCALLTFYPDRSLPEDAWL